MVNVSNLKLLFLRNLISKCLYVGLRHKNQRPPLNVFTLKAIVATSSPGLDPIFGLKRSKNWGILVTNVSGFKYVKIVSKSINYGLKIAHGLSTFITLSNL